MAKKNYAPPLTSCSPITHDAAGCFALSAAEITHQKQKNTHSMKCKVVSHVNRQAAESESEFLNLWNRLWLFARLHHQDVFQLLAQFTCKQMSSYSYDITSYIHIQPYINYYNNTLLKNVPFKLNDNNAPVHYRYFSE